MILDGVRVSWLEHLALNALNERLVGAEREEEKKKMKEKKKRKDGMGFGKKEKGSVGFGERLEERKNDTSKHPRCEVEMVKEEEEDRRLHSTCILWNSPF